MKYQVDAAWDDEAGVWVAHSDDIPGLNTEADTFEALVDRVVAVAPELLALNRARPKDGVAEIQITGNRHATLAVAA
jgi:predicted RNase H-like HicB family nuclease